MKKNDNINMSRRIIDYFRLKEIIPTIEEEDRGWNNILSEIHRNRQKNMLLKKMQYAFWTMGAAAILTGAIFLLQTQFDDKESPNMLTIYNSMDKNIETEEIRLFTEDKQMADIENNVTIDYSKSDKQVQLGNRTIDKPQDTTYHQLIVPRGKHTCLILADGSTLHVNAGTKVIYPNRFKKNHREIFVDGEIYIDVVKNEKAPFIVSTTSCDIQVLGTSFNVYAYSQENNANVALVRGSIKLKDRQKGELTLKPDELALISDYRIKEKKRVHASDYTAWTQGLLKLDATPLSSVFKRLERFYDVDISYTDEVGTMKIYGSLDLECSIDEVLRRLKYITPIIINLNEGKYMITKNIQSINQ